MLVAVLMLAAVSVLLSIFLELGSSGNESRPRATNHLFLTFVGILLLGDVSLVESVIIFFNVFAYEIDVCFDSIMSHGVFTDVSGLAVRCIPVGTK
eukprot:15326903-Ditylum_brightwellii.AAC.1